jgi:hypothetical protein
MAALLFDTATAGDLDTLHSLALLAYTGCW